MDEFVLGNGDPERRGRVAHERYQAALTGTTVEWVRLTSAEQTAWCHAAEAAFEEGRAFEREQMLAALQRGEPIPLTVEASRACTEGCCTE